MAMPGIAATNNPEPCGKELQTFQLQLWFGINIASLHQFVEKGLRVLQGLLCDHESTLADSVSDQLETVLKFTCQLFVEIHQSCRG